MTVKDQIEKLKVRIEKLEDDIQDLEQQLADADKRYNETGEGAKEWYILNVKTRGKKKDLKRAKEEFKELKYQDYKRRYML